MVGQESFRGRLDRDRNQFLVALRYGRERVGPPMPATIDPQSDPDVLARVVVTGKAPTRLDLPRRRVFRFRLDVDYHATQLSCRPERIEQLEVVVRQQRRGGPSRQTPQYVHVRAQRRIDVLRRGDRPSRQASQLRTHAGSNWMREMSVQVCTQT